MIERLRQREPVELDEDPAVTIRTRSAALILVVDASVLGHWLLTTRLPPHLIMTQFARDATLAAPHLLDAEVGHLLRRHTLVGTVSAALAQIALEDFLTLPIDRYAHTALLARAFALRDNATIYDALYLALAEVLEATRLTRDRRLARVFDVAARVEVVSDGS
jgi:predicted nucleic acid-binding protein